MKLIYIAPMLHPVGGLERTIADKANFLSAAGHEVLLLTYAQGQEKIFYTLDSRVRHQDMGCPMHYIYRFPFYRRGMVYFERRRLFRQRFQQVLTDFRPDTIVITIPNTEDFIRDMVSIARQLGVRIVIESHLASHFHLVGKPFTERLMCKLFPSHKALRQADLLVALTEHDAQYWRKIVKNVRVIPNPLTSCPSPLSSHLSSHGSHRIIAVGRLFEQKRFDRLVNAFSQLASNRPDWSLDIFGEGPLHQQLQEQIDRLHLSERVRIQAPTHQIFEEYRRSDLFVLSSDFEGFGLVIIEAMACGLPVVATNCPYGPSEIIEDGKTGLLAQLDVATLAAKMEWLITHDAERRQMGQAAQQAVARYRLDRVMPEWEKAYLGS